MQPRCEKCGGKKVIRKTKNTTDTDALYVNGVLVIKKEVKKLIDKTIPVKSEWFCKKCD